MSDWAEFFVSYGFTAMIIGPNDEINEWHIGRAQGLIDAIETRERLLDVESLLSGDKYSFVKDAYIQSIAYEVKDGINVEDDFVDDMDYFLID